MSHGLRAGQLVSSTKGRDYGQYYLVLGLDGDRVLLVNGANRPLQRPKKKNYRHVMAHAGEAADIFEKFGQGAPVDNIEVRRILAELAGEGGHREGPGEGGKDGEARCD